MKKTYTATIKRDEIEFKYSVQAETKEDAEKRLFEISGEHLKAKEVGK